MAKKRCSSIGGQAVLEGVMMRGKSSMATAVRDPSGKIVVESSRFTPFAKRNIFYRIPVIRGIFSFATSMATGMKTLTRSSEVFGGLENEEPSKFEKWVAKKFKIDIMDLVMVISVLLGLAFSVGLFIVLPHLATTGIFRLFNISEDKRILVNLTAGVIRIAIFVSYILLISLMKDVKRLFMYHGAEHKTISCYESGLELTVENAQKMSTVHDRCGTTFIFIVMVFSILFFSFDIFSNNWWQRILIRIAFVPVVAGISYEILKLFAKYDNWFTRILKAPGLLLQKITTNQPEDAMVEVAIKAFTTVMELDENPDKDVETFVTYTTIEKGVKELLGIISSQNEAELILMSVLGCNLKSDLYNGRRLSSVDKEKCFKLAKERVKGIPLQYVLGTACFYGYDFVVDKRVLIPRFDTEHLAKAAIDIAKNMETPKILDLMTGSGAIAITVKKNTDSIVTASDISEEALEVAKLNADRLGCEIDFRKGSFFEAVEGDKFDVICSNPPYIATEEIAKLDSEVADFEPVLALDGGKDGLDFYRIICAEAGKYLKTNGYLILEVGEGQAEKIKELLGDNYEISYIYDFNNPPVARVVVAKLLMLAENSRVI